MLPVPHPTVPSWTQRGLNGSRFSIAGTSGDGMGGRKSSRDPHFSADFVHFLVGIKLISPLLVGFHLYLPTNRLKVWIFSLG